MLKVVFLYDICLEIYSFYADHFICYDIYGHVMVPHLAKYDSFHASYDLAASFKTFYTLM